MPGNSRGVTTAKTERIQLLVSEEELRSIDDVRFEKRIPSRAEAVRMLVRKGMEAVANEQRRGS